MQENYKKYFLWIILSATIKVIFYFILIYPNLEKSEHIGPFILSNDHSEYISPTDNLIDKGIYSLNKKNESYAGRLPGFIFPYILFRVFFNAKVSGFLLGIFIFLMACISNYLACLLSYKISKSYYAFIFTFLFLNILPYFFFWDFILHPYSLAFSVLVLALYFLDLFVNDFKRLTMLLLSGLTFTWLFMLRGYTVFFIPIVFFFLVYYLRRKGMKIRLLALFVYFLPLLFFESLWVLRNYMVFDKFIPLQTDFINIQDSKNSSYTLRSPTKFSMLKLRELIDCWGGDNFWYFKHSDMSWFFTRDSTIDMDDYFNHDIYFTGFSKDTLIELKKDVLYSYLPTTNGKLSDSIEQRIINKSVRLKKSFKENRKFYYWVKAPVYRLKNFLLKNPTQDWPTTSFNESNLFIKFLKIFSFSQYYCILLLSLFFFFIKRKSTYQKLYVLMALSVVFVFTFMINATHYSYFSYSFLLLVLVASMTISEIFEGVFKNKFS